MSDTPASHILQAVESGDARAAAELLPLVYDELRRLAARELAGERPGQTLQATALVHEAYMRLVGNEPRWNGRTHFFRAAANTMHRILIDHARSRRAARHGGNGARVELGEGPAAASLPADELIDLDEALTRLAAEDPGKAELVKLRYFAGLTLEEAAAVLGISRATASRHWDYARAWLRCEMGGRGA